MPSKTTTRCSPEIRERAVRMVLDDEAQHPSRCATILAIAGKTGFTAGRRIFFGGVDVGQGLRAVALLLANRPRSVDGGELTRNQGVSP